MQCVNKHSISDWSWANQVIWIGNIIRKRPRGATCLPTVHSFVCSSVGVMGLTFTCMNVVNA